MKDADARERLSKLEWAVARSPEAVSELLIEHFKPRFDSVNETLAAMREAADGIEILAEHVNSNGELLQVLESEVNTLRVDANASRETIADLAASIADLRSRLQAVVNAFVGVSFET